MTARPVYLTCLAILMLTTTLANPAERLVFGQQLQSPTTQNQTYSPLETTEEKELSSLPQPLQPEPLYRPPPPPLPPPPPQVRPLQSQLQAATYSPCPRAIKINTNYHFRGALHFICLQATRSRPLLEVIQYQSRRVISSAEVDDFGANQLASFVDDEGTLRILLAVPNRINGTSMYSIDSQGRFIKEKHSVNTQLVNAMTIWRLELNWEWQLATVNQPNYEPLIGASLYARAPMPEPKPMITIHSWRPSYFDQYQLIHLPQDGKVNKLEPMTINGQEFLIVALESNKPGHARRTGPPQANHYHQSSTPSAASVESLIYKLDFGDGNLNWLQFQYLNTRLALDVKSFAVTHKGSLRKDYYIALLGQAGSPSRPMVHYNLQGYARQNHSNAPHLTNNNDDGQYGLLIYKYFGDKFMRTNSIPVAGATKLDAISYGQGDSYVIIALLSEWSHQISLFLFDGLALRPMASPAMPQQRLVGVKRTLDSTGNLHLFLAPQEASALADETTKSNNDSSSSVKRTLIDETQFLTMPALALSNTYDDDDDDDGDRQQDSNNTQREASPDDLNATTTSTSTVRPRREKSAADSVYQIPINELIKESQLLDQQQHKQPIESDKEDSSEPTKRNYVDSQPGVGQQQQQNLLAWCKDTINYILADNFDMDAKRLLALPRIDQLRPIELNGDLIIEDDLHVTNLLYAGQVLEGPPTQPPPLNLPQVVVDNIRSNFSETFDKIQRTHMEIDSIKRQVDQILVDDGSDQDVFNPLTFETLVVDCPSPLNSDPRPRLMLTHPKGLVCPHVNELRTNWLNSQDISGIQRQALLTGRSMSIMRDVRFEHLILHGSVDILGTLNGIHVNEIVFKRGPSTGPIHGHKDFLNGLFSSSKLAVDNWNHARVDRQNFLTSSGDQRIDAEVGFTQIVLDPDLRSVHNGSSRIEKLNNRHLDLHLSQIALADEDNNFDVPVHFEELILNGPVQFTANSRLSSIDIESLWLNTMFKQSNQNITAPIEFAGDVHVSYGGDILVDGPLNGIPRFAPGNVLMRNQDYTLPNPIIFEHDLIVGDLRLTKALNGIQVVLNQETGNYELAILYDGGTQIISGDKVLSEVHLGGHSTISGNINGNLNLTRLYHLTNNNNGRPYEFSTVRLAGQNIQVADGVRLHIDSTINGIPVNDICNLANRVSSSLYANYSRLKFEQPIYFKSLRCATINGFNNLASSFMTRYGNQHAAGTLKLTNGVIFDTSVQIGSTLNGLQVRPMSQAIASTVSESRTGHKEIYGDLIIDELFTERINNLTLSRVFLARADIPQVIHAKMIFDHLDIENVLTVGHNLVTNTFNGINITDVMSNTLQYDTPQIIYNHVEVNTLQLLAGSNFMTKSVNGHDLQRLYADAVLIDSPQQILAPKTFKAPASFRDRVSLRHGIDGLSSEGLRLNLLLHSDELIDGDLEFTEDVVIKKELEIQSGVINDIDLNLFVDSMLYENRPDRKGLRIVGNGSVRFKDVMVNNLVVAGTIQGVDLSREALLRGENTNGSYDSRIRELQVQSNNQRLLNSAYGPGSSFKVQSNYRGSDHWGTCYVHSCSPTSIQTPSVTPPPPLVSEMRHTTPMVSRYSIGQPPPQFGLSMANQTQSRVIQPGNRFAYDIQHHHQPPIQYVQQFYPHIMPKPLNLVNVSNIPTWQPKWEQLTTTALSTPPQKQPPVIVNRPPPPPPPPQSIAPAVVPMPTPVMMNYSQPIRTIYPQQQQPQQYEQTIQSIEESSELVDLKYLEYKSKMQAQAIRDLARRVNQYLSISFYYEIVQKHPLLGPLLNAASNPILNEEGSALLLLKATSKLGEPCLRRGQTIAVMAQQRARTISAFTQSSRIQETSNPLIVESVVAGYNNHYLFILDSYHHGPGSSESMMNSQVLVYLWDYKSGMYELRERIMIDGFPTAMKAFRGGNNGIACFSLANPRVTQANFTSGPPVVYCQYAPLSLFSERHIIPVPNVFDLDVISASPDSSRIIIAALSRQSTEQIGDLNVNSYDLRRRRMQIISLRRMVRPMKLHLYRNFGYIQLAVSEAITSSDDAQAITRLFSIRPTVGLHPPGVNRSDDVSTDYHLYESQLLKDNQFYDIQSVLLDSKHSLLFFQSAHSISVYAPSPSLNNSLNCDAHYSLIQRLPTKGANKFLVFNDRLISHAGFNNTEYQQQHSLPGGNRPYNHFLVLSKDHCDQQQYTTLIMRAKFH